MLATFALIFSGSITFANPASASGFADCFSVQSSEIKTLFSTTYYRVTYTTRCGNLNVWDSHLYYYFAAGTSQYTSFPMNSDGSLYLPSWYGANYFEIRLQSLSAGTYYPKIKVKSYADYSEKTITLPSFSVKGSGGTPSGGGGGGVTSPLPAATPTLAPVPAPTTVTPTPAAPAPTPTAAPTSGSPVITDPAAIAAALAVKPSPQATYGFPEGGGDIPPQPGVWALGEIKNKLWVSVLTNTKTPVTVPTLTISVYDNKTSEPRCSQTFTAGQQPPFKIRCEWPYPWGAKNYSVYAVTTYPGGYISEPAWKQYSMKKKRQ